MKIIIAYPPLTSKKGYPTLGQNRQFQYFKAPTYIYPVVPATLATMLKEAGHEVIWFDCIASRTGSVEFYDKVFKESPDMVVFETKTPVIKEHWKIIDRIKLQSPGIKCVLFGDHVTALPEESFHNSAVDFVVTGGDYDFLLLNLCNYLVKKDIIEPGIYYRDSGKVKNTGVFRLEHDLDSLPFIDRQLTQWKLYAYENGNYKRTPGTYIMSARDCWWGKCSFCSWPALYPKFRARRPENVLNEIGMLIERFQVREIMDDSGSFPVGDWLKEFCCGMIKHGYNKEIYLDCNMRFGALTKDDFTMMKKANFRLLLFGLESANQDTLDRIKKNMKVESVIQGCKAATEAGLFPHITIMFGYPWETYQDALNTLKLGKWLLKKGYAYTMQATMVVPYPGTPLFEECGKRGWLKTLDWADYDMKKPVISSSIPDEKMLKLVQGMYKVSFSPEFVARKISSLRDWDDVKYAARAVKKVAGHLFDFSKA